MTEANAALLAMLWWELILLISSLRDISLRNWVYFGLYYCSLLLEKYEGVTYSQGFVFDFILRIFFLWKYAADLKNN